MSKFLIAAGFIIMILLQWLVPGEMIYQQEGILTKGTAYKFKTEPMDPYDPFRGKYINLNYEIDRYATNLEEIDWEDEIFVYVEKDSLGYAKIKEISLEALKNDDDYFIAKSNGLYNGIINLQFPFDIFYMEESKAYDAEVAVRNARRSQDSIIAYANVFLLDGKAGIENVYINDIPVNIYVGQD